MARLYTEPFSKTIYIYIYIYISLSFYLEKIPFLPMFTFSRNVTLLSYLILSYLEIVSKAVEEIAFLMNVNALAGFECMYIMECNNSGASSSLSSSFFFFNRFEGNPAQYVPHGIK